MILQLMPEQSSAATSGAHIYLHSDAKSAPQHIQNQFSEEIQLVSDYTSQRDLHLLLKADEDENVQLEKTRNQANACYKILRKYKVKQAIVESILDNKNLLKAFLEGFLLSNYQFKKYKTKETEPVLVNKLLVSAEKLNLTEVNQLNNNCQAVFLARDLVNEPLSYLTAPQLAKEIQHAFEDTKATVEVWDKAKIKAENMNGLLAVNLGSITPPSFSIIEYKHKEASKQKPIVLVGKGVVYDTGGLSLKPTANSMDMMKSDMGGAAAVIGAMKAVVSADLPLHIIALIPATDNRPGQDAYAPGDVVHMHNGMTVEVLNTDAEGRMLLADALSYAKNYDPELVIDLATLTGASVRALGSEGVAFMGTCKNEIKEQLFNAGFKTHERLVEFPLWPEYGNMLKSAVADVKNIGGAVAGSITAGKFLEHFTNYPWMHLDIAGTAYLLKEQTYRGIYATGFGVRLIFEFLKNYKV